MLFGLWTGETCAVGSDVLVAKLEFRVVDPEPVPGGGTLLVNERRRCHPSIIPLHSGRGMRGTLDSAGNRSRSGSHQGKLGLLRFGGHPPSGASPRKGCSQWRPWSGRSPVPDGRSLRSSS